MRNKINNVLCCLLPFMIAGVLVKLIVRYELDDNITKGGFPAIYVGYIAIITALTASLFMTLTFFSGALKNLTDTESNKDGSLDEIVKSIIKKRATVIFAICIMAIISIFFLFWGLFEVKHVEIKIFDECLRIIIFRISSFLSISIIIGCAVFFTNNTNIDRLIFEEAKKQLSKNKNEIENLIKKNIIGTKNRKPNKYDFFEEYKKIKKELSKSIDLNGLLMNMDPFKLAYYRIVNSLDENERMDYIKNHEQKWGNSQLFLKFASQIKCYITVIIRQNVLAEGVEKQEFKNSFEWLYTRDKIFEKEGELKKHFYKTQLGIQNERRYKDALFDIAILHNYDIPYEPTEKYRKELKLYCRALNSNLKWKNKYQNVENYKKKNLLCSIKLFFDYYEKMINYRNAFKWMALLNYNEMDDYKKDVFYPYMLAKILHRVLFDKYASNVKLNEINMGSSDFSKAWLNYSDLSGSNFRNSNFKLSHLCNATLKNCDLSVSNFYLVDAKHAIFTNSNLSDSSFIGAVLDGSDFTNCLLDDVFFRNPLIDALSGAEQKKTFDLSENLKKIGSNLKKSNFEPTKEDFENLVNPYRNCVIRPDVFKQIEMGSGDDANKIIKHYKESYGDIDNENKLYVYLRSVASLRQATMDKVSLRNVDLSYIDLTGSSFNDSILTGAWFHYSKGIGVNFTNANLSENVIFNETKFSSAVFKNSNLFRAIFVNCNCQSSIFKFSNLTEAIILGTLKSVTIKSDKNDKFDTNSNFSDANLSEIDAINLHIYNTNLGKTVIVKSNLKGSNLVNNSFRYADLSETNITNSFLYANTFYQACLNFAILINTKLSDCDFRQASLVKAVMLRAFIIKADFTSANLSNVNFSVARLEKVIFNDCAFDSINFTKSEFKHCDFTDINVKNAIGITRDTFSNCTFTNVILSKADLNKIKNGKQNKLINIQIEKI